MSSGVPSLADRLYARSVPYCAFATVYVSVVSNVPRQPVPQVAMTCSSTSVLPDASRIATRKVASKTFALPVTRAGLPIAARYAGRSTKIDGSWS